MANNNSIPIFLVHQGNQSYLSATIMHIKKRFPNNDVYLIGDLSNCKLSGIDYSFLIDDLECTKANEFQKNYFHLSPNPYDYELFCFKRWFYLLEAMEKMEIKKALYIDSDVLLCALSESLTEVEENCFFHCHESPHTMLVLLDVLRRFCGFMLQEYTDETKLNDLKLHYRRRIEQNKIGGVSDMTMTSLFAYVMPHSCDLASLCRMPYYDHNVNCCDGFELFQGKKAIYYLEGNYYFRNNMTGIMVEVGSIHFQGDAKNHIEAVSKAPSKSGNKLWLYDWKKCIWVSASPIIERKSIVYRKLYSLEKKIVYKFERIMRVVRHI